MTADEIAIRDDVIALRTELGVTQTWLFPNRAQNGHATTQVAMTSFYDVLEERLHERIIYQDIRDVAAALCLQEDSDGVGRLTALLGHSEARAALRRYGVFCHVRDLMEGGGRTLATPTPSSSTESSRQSEDQQ